MFDDELKSIRWRIFSRFDQYCFIEKENEKKMKIEIKKMKKKRERGEKFDYLHVISDFYWIFDRRKTPKVNEANSIEMDAEHLLR